MLYLFIHFEHLEQVKHSFSNYLRHCGKFNDIHLDIKKHNQYIREMNRKIKHKTKTLFGKYGWFDFTNYNLGDQLYKGYLVYLEIYDKKLYDNIVYDNAVNIVKIIEDSDKYWGKIMDYKHNLITEMRDNADITGDTQTLILLKRISDVDDMISPIRDRLSKLNINN